MVGHKMTYYYAHINAETKQCIGILGAKHEVDHPELVYIGEEERREICGKYLVDGQWADAPAGS